MNKKQLIEDSKKASLRILALSTGIIASSILLGIGISLIVERNIWFGVFPIVAGYELLRYLLKFLIKYHFPITLS